MSIKYGSIDRISVPRRPLPKRAWDKARRVAQLRANARRAARMRELGLCVACGTVYVTHFAKCLKCRLNGKGFKRSAND